VKGTIKMIIVFLIVFWLLAMKEIQDAKRRSYRRR
jgi:hypothetical protein